MVKQYFERILSIYVVSVADYELSIYKIFCTTKSIYSSSWFVSCLFIKCLYSIMYWYSFIIISEFFFERNFSHFTNYKYYFREFRFQCLIQRIFHKSRSIWPNFCKLFYFSTKTRRHSCNHIDKRDVFIHNNKDYLCKNLLLKKFIAKLHSFFY